MIARSIPPEVWTDYDVVREISLELERQRAFRKTGAARIAGRNEDGPVTVDVLFCEVIEDDYEIEVPASEVDFVLACQRLRAETVFEDASVPWKASEPSLQAQNGARCWVSFHVGPDR